MKQQSETTTNRKSLTVAFILFASLSISFSARAQKINYSGTWKINHDATDFGKFGEPSAAIELDITQTKDTLTTKRISKSKIGDIHDYTEKLAFDGKITEAMNRTTKKKASIKWSDDKKSLIESADYKDYSVNISYKAVETWTLSDDGKTLTIDRIDDGDDGHGVSKLVYDKQ